MVAELAPPPLRVATRYVAPLREGGSLPGLVEADDDGLYVLKFRGAGQGPKALVAEVVVAAIARRLALLVPDTVLIRYGADFGRAEPDPEIQELLRASEGLNLGVDFLPGSVAYDPAAGEPPDPELAAAIVWLDALALNVDRTARNPNLLLWHGRLWLIDHGAALYPHHGGPLRLEDARRPFPQVADHVLLPAAGSIAEADARLAGLLDRPVLEGIAASVPDAWLAGPGGGPDPGARRAGYVDYLAERLRAPRQFAEEAERARRKP